MILLQSLVSNHSTVIHNLEDFCQPRDWGWVRECVPCCCCWDCVFVCAHSLLSDNTSSSNANHIVKFWHLSCSRSLAGRLLHYSCLHAVNQCWDVGCLFSIFSRVYKCFSVSILVIFTMKAMLLNSCTGKTHPSSYFRERWRKTSPQGTKTSSGQQLCFNNGNYSLQQSTTKSSWQLNALMIHSILHVLLNIKCNYKQSSICILLIKDDFTCAYESRESNLSFAEAEQNDWDWCTFPQPTYCLACITIVTKTNARAPTFRLVEAGGRSGLWGGEGAKFGPTAASKQTSLSHPPCNHAT